MKVRQNKVFKPPPDGDDGRWALDPTLVCHVKRTVELPLGCCPINAKPMERVKVLLENQARPLVRVHDSTQEAVAVKSGHHMKMVEMGSAIAYVLEEAGIPHP